MFAAMVLQRAELIDTPKPLLYILFYICFYLYSTRELVYICFYPNILGIISPDSTSSICSLQQPAPQCQ